LPRRFGKKQTIGGKGNGLEVRSYLFGNGLASLQGLTKAAMVFGEIVYYLGTV
jgi:hypothetical protein